jgi:7-cyano-7-deazaguanine reductase
MKNATTNNTNILGQNISIEYYQQPYSRNILYAIPRADKRTELNIAEPINFMGIDIWNAYEFSWLNNKGKPQVAIVQFIFDANTPYIIESKSFKLYLNTFNQTQFENENIIQTQLQQDLTQACGGRVQVYITLAHNFDSQFKQGFKKSAGLCLDRLDIDVNCYDKPCTDFLNVNNTQAPVQEVLYSNLLKSNCLVTGQPDWASIEIGYSGAAIQQEGLLKYLISFRNHQEFHEQCVERIFSDIMQYCKPIKLYVYAQYTRRGGLDINPFRSNYTVQAPNFIRHARQ